MSADPAAPALSGPACALIAFGLMAIGDAAAKALAVRNPPLQIAFLYTVSAVAIVAVWASRQDWRTLRPRHPGLIGVRAACSVTAGLAGLYAFVKLSLAEAYTILFTAPVIVTALSRPVLGEAVGLRRWLAALAGIAGIALVLRPGFRDLGVGHAAALLAATAVAVSGLVLRQIGSREARATLTLVPMGAGLLVTTATLPFVYVPMRLADLAICLVVGALIAAAQVMLVNAYRASPAAVVAPFHYSQMVWALIFGALLFGDRPDPWLAGGAAAVIGSGLILLWLDQRATTASCAVAPP
jgi:drug/metabolite transporter (DMT)-like permease